MCDVGYFYAYFRLPMPLCFRLRADIHDRQTDRQTSDRCQTRIIAYAYPRDGGIITLCYTPTHTSNRCLLKSFTSCAFCGRLAAPDFVMKCIEAMLFGGQKSGSSTGLVHYCSFGLEATNDAQNVRVDTARREDNDQQNLSKNDNVILQHL